MKLYLRAELGAFLMCLALVACAKQRVVNEDSNPFATLNSPAPHEVENCELAGSAAGIVGGQTLASGNDLSSSTVLIVIKSSAGQSELCTGTLIDRNLVITAAHCAAPGIHAAIAFTNNLVCATKAPGRVLRPVVAATAHPQYDFKTEGLLNSSRDLAVLKFEGEMPKGFRFRDLPAATVEPKKQDELVLAGFGISAENSEDSGVLRVTHAPATQLLRSFHMAGSVEEIAVPNTWLLDQLNTGVCSGDSGGPMYIKSAVGLTLIGVTSTGVNNRSTSRGLSRVCHGVSLFTDVRAHIPWLRTVITRMK